MNDKDKLNQVADLLPGIRDYCLRCSRLSALGMMSSLVMHDIRNSLTIIYSLIQLMQLTRGEIDREELDSRLAQMTVQIDHILNFINGVGRFGERSQGKAIIFSPDAALDLDLKALKRDMESAGLKVEYLRSECVREMRCDASLLDYVLLELLTYLLSQHSGSGDLIVQSSELPDAWKVRAHLQYTQDGDPTSEEDNEIANSFILMTVQWALEKLDGALELFPDRKGWELSFPWKDDGMITL